MALAEGANRLPVLAQEVKAAAADIRSHGAMTLRRALDAGASLIEAKALLSHGEWLPWLAAVDIPDRTAQIYMRLARNRVAVELQSVAIADLTITAAAAGLSSPLVSGRTLHGLDVDETEVWVVPATRHPGHSFVTIVTPDGRTGGFLFDALTRPLRNYGIPALLHHLLLGDPLELRWTELEPASWTENLFLSDEPELRPA